MRLRREVVVQDVMSWDEIEVEIAIEVKIEMVIVIVKYNEMHAGSENDFNSSNALKHCNLSDVNLVMHDQLQGIAGGARVLVLVLGLVFRVNMITNTAARMSGCN